MKKMKYPIVEYVNLKSEPFIYYTYVVLLSTNYLGVQMCLNLTVHMTFRFFCEMQIFGIRKIQ